MSVRTISLAEPSQQATSISRTGELTHPLLLRKAFVKCAEGARIHRWWKPTNTLMAMGRSVTQVGKPPVPFRKVITTELPDGRQVTVNAQQYVVLAYDVPPPPSAHK